jgi:hypothetical protein
MLRETDEDVKRLSGYILKQIQAPKNEKAETGQGLTIGGSAGEGANFSLVLPYHERNPTFTRMQHGQRGSVLSKAAAVRNRKLVIDDSTWYCARAGLPRGL